MSNEDETMNTQESVLPASKHPTYKIITGSLVSHGLSHSVARSEWAGKFADFYYPRLI